MAMNVELRGCGREGDKVTPEHLPFTIHRNGVVDMQRWDNELSRGGAIHHYFRAAPAARSRPVRPPTAGLRPFR